MRRFRMTALAAALALAACGSPRAPAVPGPAHAVRYVAAGPAIAHAEGHIVFLSSS